MDRNRKKIIRRLIVWGIILILLAALAYVFYLIYSERDIASGRSPLKTTRSPWNWTEIQHSLKLPARKAGRPGIPIRRTGKRIRSHTV